MLSFPRRATSTLAVGESGDKASPVQLVKKEAPSTSQRVTLHQEEFNENNGSNILALPFSNSDSPIVTAL